MSSEEGVPVDLYIYDLTNGMASLLSSSIIGRQIEGVWHTSIVAYEREFFYGGGGVTSCAPGGTQLGAPHQVERLGETFVPFQVFVDYMQGLATTSYTPSAYRLLEHNCNHFSEEVAQFLCGAHVPKHIVNQPEQLLTPPQRLALQALLDNLVPHSAQSVYNGVRHSRQDSPEYLTLNTQIEEARCTCGSCCVRACVRGVRAAGAVLRAATEPPLWKRAPVSSLHPSAEDTYQFEIRISSFTHLLRQLIPVHGHLCRSCKSCKTTRSKRRTRHKSSVKLASMTLV